MLGDSLPFPIEPMTARMRPVNVLSNFRPVHLITHDPDRELRDGAQVIMESIRTARQGGLIGMSAGLEIQDTASKYVSRSR